MIVKSPKIERRTFLANPDYSLDFEYTMMLLFGDDADHIASFAKHEKYLKKWLRRAVKRFIKDINLLDTTERHKEMLIVRLQSIDKLLKNGGDLWSMVFDFFNLTARFLGYDYIKAQKLVTPTYFQTQFQNFWSGLYKGDDWRKQQEQKDNLTPKDIVNQIVGGALKILRTFIRSRGQGTILK